MKGPFEFRQSSEHPGWASEGSQSTSPKRDQGRFVFIFNVRLSFQVGTKQWFEDHFGIILIRIYSNPISLQDVKPKSDVSLLNSKHLPSRSSPSPLTSWWWWPVSPRKDHLKNKITYGSNQFLFLTSAPNYQTFPEVRAVPFGLWFDLGQTDELIDCCEGPQKQQPLEKKHEKNQWQVQ